MGQAGPDVWALSHALPHLYNFLRLSFLSKTVKEWEPTCLGNLKFKLTQPWSPEVIPTPTPSFYY